MEDFKSLGLPQPLMQSLERMQFDTPTPVQAQAIPPALEGKDVLGSAQTGTGKTGAFGIPLVTMLMSTPRGSGLIMTPTRELAVQVMQMLEQLLGKQTKIKTALIIGGESMPKQVQQLRMRPRLIVGTPGRINDHLERGNLMLHDTKFLVLDEMDRMLDMGFTIQIDKILKFLPAQRQTLLFSATLPKNIERLAASYLNNPVRVSVGSTTATAANLKQEVIHVSEVEKYGALLTQLDEREGSIIIFMKTKRNADKMSFKLRDQGYTAEAIHGDLRQNKRDKVIKGFRSSKYRILVATDIAARGLDIPHIEHVINFDLPQCPEDYIHRIGRTARAGAEGSALCLLTPKDKGQWAEISYLLDPTLKKPSQGGGGNSRGGNRGGNGGSNAGGKGKRPFKARSKHRKGSQDGHDGGSGPKGGARKKSNPNRKPASAAGKPAGGNFRKRRAGGGSGGGSTSQGQKAA